MLALKLFSKELGVPEAIITDVAKAKTSLKVKAFCINIGTTLKKLEEGMHLANLAEFYAGLIKSFVGKNMKWSDYPLRLWDYCVERNARINNVPSRNNFKLQGSHPHASVTGEQGDMSNTCQFDWC